MQSIIGIVMGGISNALVYMALEKNRPKSAL
jgi:tetrahydromethanopterin S-methyltransferase subunit D